MERHGYAVTRPTGVVELDHGRLMEDAVAAGRVQPGIDPLAPLVDRSTCSEVIGWLAGLEVAHDAEMDAQLDDALRRDADPTP